MNGLNKAFFIGRLGQEPELRSTPAGVTLVRFSLATPHSRKVGDEWKEETDWHRITSFGSNAEYLAKYAHKGDAAAIECAVRQNKWTDKEGKVHYETNFVVDRVLWLFSRPRASDAPGLSTPPVPTIVVGDRSDETVEEIPF